MARSLREPLTHFPVLLGVVPVYFGERVVPWPVRFTSPLSALRGSQFSSAKLDSDYSGSGVILSNFFLLALCRSFGVAKSKE